MKIQLTESQFDRLQPQLRGMQTEDAAPSNQYTRDISVHFYHSGVVYQGHEINDVEKTRVRVTFLIDIDARSWGIKDISLYNISGPSELDAYINFFLNDDEEDYANVKLKINWDALKVEKQKGQGTVTVGDELEITLVNDRDGNVIVGGLSLEVSE